MSLTISKEEYQEIEMFLNIIKNDAQHLTSGNVAHKASSIVLHAEAIKNKLNKPKYKCYTCKDSGEVEDPAFHRGEGKFIPCPFCSKKTN